MSSLGGWWAGTHDSTWPITALDDLGIIIGLEDGHVTQRPIRVLSWDCFFTNERAAGLLGLRAVVVLAQGLQVVRPPPRPNLGPQSITAGLAHVATPGCHPHLVSPGENTAWEPRSLMLLQKCHADQMSTRVSCQ